MKKTMITTPFRPVYPTPVGMIVAADENGKANIMTAGEVFNISLRDPCIIGIALRKATYTHSLIEKTKEFTVNFATTAIMDKADGCGLVTGRHGLDKFKEFGLTALISTQVKPPIIQECPMNLECKMLSVTEVGDHDLFLGKVVAMHVDEDKVDEKQKVHIEKMDGFFFSEWEYFSFGKKIGHLGYSQKRVAAPE